MKKHELTEKKVFSYLEGHHMIVPGDKIVLGVSGGADSVCLLFLLLEYKKKVPLTLAVVHVNHGIRPEAGEDAAYVRELCREHQIPFYLIEEDVRERARLEKCSEEDAGRRVRYEAFATTAVKLEATKIAVAHNSDDNAETMLLHLFRGSGLGGLCGIAPMRRLEAEEVAALLAHGEKRSDVIGTLQLIRPILCLRRNEIEDYLSDRGISWRRDCTNETDDYTRNRIRHNIMPYAEQYIAANASARMHKTAELLQETEEYLELQTKEALLSCLVQDGEEKSTELPLPAGNLQETGKRFVLLRSRFQTLHPALQKRILFKLAKELSPTGKDISQVHVADMLTLFQQEGNRTIHLPFGIVVRQQYNHVILERGGSPQVSGIGGKVEISLISEKNSEKLPQNQYTKWFDYDKINGYLEVRTRRQGDYLTISDGAGGIRHKSLKDYMITEKIPRELRDRIPVLAVGSHVLWLVGYRISEEFKVRENTKQILQAEFKTGE